MVRVLNQNIYHWIETLRRLLTYTSVYNIKNYNSMKRYLRMDLFNMNKEIAFLNNRALCITFSDGTTTLDILFEGSKNLPRKKKKKLRKLIQNEKNSSKNRG